jgi:hypothetical protein
VKDKRGVMGIHDPHLWMQLLNKASDVQLMIYTALSVIGRSPDQLQEPCAKMWAADAQDLPADQYYQFEGAAATAYLEWAQGLHRDSPELQGLDPDLREAIVRVFSTDLSVRPTAEELLAIPCFKHYIPAVTGIVDQQRPEHLQERDTIRVYLQQHLTLENRPDVAYQRYEAALRHQADLERQRAEY